MKKSLTFLTIISLLLPNISLATEFNPNFIITDEAMQNKDAMNATDIQVFLQEKNSYLSDFVTEYIDGTNRKASYIIYDSAQKYNISPKYLLVKLQKEQSLVTEDSPTQKQLDWATGFAVCDSCAMDDPKIQEYKGFVNQVDSAAAVMRSYYNKYVSQSWIKRAGQSYTIDGEIVTPANNATAFLYTYTPHLHGNENFWTIWQAWFEQSYPDGTLAKTSDSSDIYLIQDGKKRKIANMTSLVTRFDQNLIITIPASELAKLEAGSEIKLPNYAIVNAPSGYYLLDYEYKRKFDSYDVVKKIGYNPDEVIDVTESDLNDYSLGEPISLNEENVTGKLLKLKVNGEMYYIKGNKYYPIIDKNIAKINFPDLTIEDAEVSEFSTLNRMDPILPKDGSIIGIEGSPYIYVMENGKKRHIADEKAFNTFGYNWNNIIWLNFYSGLIIPDGQALQLIEQLDTLDMATKVE
ncbi:MAG: hypothetical protein COX80_01685 [Candidatus Magasanikbacteria bacterium CG_4_10_14_0_2_um_filter_33_14]|uniref:Curculin domain protein (Mannose-binding) lectin n=1 Tax=Candidatus Magasanikbacteria bacterium CG_4_10_14_0_2_um_filter_33_14 TaxID=1974636 RepID=A0A2M7VB68_9BACT|nr:MAG: hypothetical protein COX80_01685 [Candidatus Magasanikbacteria bacterium CG_4_10_14_0_2_um_filter_33_14]